MSCLNIPQRLSRFKLAFVPVSVCLAMTANIHPSHATTMTDSLNSALQQASPPALAVSSGGVITPKSKSTTDTPSPVIFQYDDNTSTYTVSRLNGELITSLRGAYQSVELYELPDINGDNINEYGLFGVRSDAGNEGKYRFSVMSGSNGERIVTHNWPANWTDARIVILDDLTGDGIEEIGLQGNFLVGNRPQLIVKNGATSDSHLTFSIPDLLDEPQYNSFSDMTRDGVSEISLFGRIKRNAKPQAKIMDGTNPENRLPAYNFPDKWSDVEWLNVQDRNADGTSDWALFGRNKEDGRWQLMIKDGTNVRGAISIYAWPSLEDASLHLIPDMTGDGVSELAVAGLDEARGRYRMIIKDGQNRSRTLHTVAWPLTVQGHSFHVLPDRLNDGLPEVAMLAESDGLYSLLIRYSEDAYNTLERVVLGTNWTTTPSLGEFDLNGDGVVENIVWEAGGSPDNVVAIPAPSSFAPVANAEVADEALALSSVDLSGTASYDIDGNVVSYRWVQIDNGAPAVVVNNATGANATFALPDLSANIDFAFRLTVTDNEGESSFDDVLVTGRPAPNVLVSEVTGNTATLNAVAEFSVQLGSAPSADVIIPLTSSDEAEGVLEQTELVFTQNNWQQSQTVTVRGVNPDTVNGEQNYQIILGSVTSADNFYDGLDPQDITLKGIELTLAPPVAQTPLVANLLSVIEPQITYTGSNQLSFSLTNSPDGMNIDLSTGKITWVPQNSDEGQTYTVSLAVNDGSKFATTDFDVAVVAPTPVQSEISGNILSVRDSTTSLNGLTITAQSTPPSTSRATTSSSDSTAELSELNLARLTTDTIPQIPDWITPLTDVFVVRGSFDNSLQLRFPINSLANGVSLSDLGLYAYIDAEDVEGKFWSPVSIDINFEGTLDSPVIVIDVGGLEGMAFLGYATPQSSVTAQSSDSQTRASVMSVGASTASTNGVTCTQQFFFTVPLDKYICSTSEDQDIRITVTGYGSDNSRWGGNTGGVTREQFIGWLLDAQGEFANSGLGFDKEFKVKIHAMDYLGYVTTANFEGRRTLHISDDNSIAVSTIQGTAVHEYFHHAQGHSDTKMENSDLLIDGTSRRSWLIEGTARWFEDELYDSLNTYKLKEGGRGYRIAEVGVNADSGNGKNRPYQRFGFFKLLSSSCQSFRGDLKTALNVNLATDPSGASNLVANFDDWTCDFGSHLGPNNNTSMASALTYYNYATQFRGDISLLDANESTTSFQFDAPTASFNKTWYTDISTWLDNAAGSVYTLNGVSNIPTAGAYSFKIPAISGTLPDGKVAELIVESDREVIVSIVSADPNFTGTNTIGSHAHSWFSTNNQTSYIYDANGNVPELFVTLANQDLVQTANVRVSFAIRDELDVDAIITSHVNGDQVDNRVVSIAGSIPEEARELTSKVVVTANGIATETTLNYDGSFVADVVVTLGNNTITAQGFNGSTPITNQEIVNIQGVENPYAGRNALIPSRVVFVLRWDTNSTDIDIYSTDKANNTIWYRNTSVGYGNLDFDNTSGYGPEVVSYRADSNDVFVNGSFDVDVHYYSGSAITNYTLDVVLNETDGNNRRSLKFDSIVPHTQSNYSDNGPDGTGDSRFNDVVSISCSAQQVCSLAAIDASKVVRAGEASSTTQTVRSVNLDYASDSKASVNQNAEQLSALDKCEQELASYINKGNTNEWVCAKDGTKHWH